MNPRPLLFVAIALPLAAQTPSSPIRAVGAMQAVTHTSGLQADRDGDGLTGLGAAYRVRFRDRAVRYEPALGDAVPTTQFVELTQPSVTRGGIELPVDQGAARVAKDRVVSLRRADGVEERFEVQPDGVELSWTFATRPPGEGDLVVRYAIATSLGAPTGSEGGLSFARDCGGVHIGKVTGIDARGHRVDGSVQWDGSGVRLALPATFVDSAAYPIVLDPLLGTSFPVGNNSGSAGAVDAAYDASTNRWFVVWIRSFSATDHDPQGQLVDNSTATLVGPGLSLDAGTSLCDSVHVANLGVRNRFGIVFTKTVGTSHFVEFRTADAASTSIGAVASVATSTVAAFRASDIGAECEAPIGTPRGFVITYEDGVLHAIRALRVYFDAADVLTLQAAFSVWTDGASGTFTDPAIARAASSDGRLLVVAKQLGASGNSAIVAAVLDTGGNGVGATTTVASSASDNLASPDVDGFASRWVIAYQAPGGSPALSGQAARVRPVTLDAATNTLTVGAGSSFGGFATNQAFPRSVAYAAGRTWFAYQSVGSVLGGGMVTQLRVAAVDTGSCASCAEQFVVGSNNGRVAVATMTSGGMTGGEDALSLVSQFPNVSAQRLRDFGTVGTTASLGGGCGGTGATLFPHAPGIGSSGFRCSLDFIPATVVAAIFNFSVPTATIPCGPCVWTPFAVTQTPPIVGGSAFIEFAIPCLLSLVGQQFETQWTMIDFTQAPCALFPGLALSNRTLLTIGN